MHVLVVAAAVAVPVGVAQGALEPVAGALGDPARAGVGYRVTQLDPVQPELEEAPAGERRHRPEATPRPRAGSTVQ